MIDLAPVFFLLYSGAFFVVLMAIFRYANTPQVSLDCRDGKHAGCEGCTGCPCHERTLRNGGYR